MKKIPFNHKIALENPKAVVKTKGGNLVTGLRYREHLGTESVYKLFGRIEDYVNINTRFRDQVFTLCGCYWSDCRSDDWNLELYVPFTSLWDRIKYYLKKS